MKYLKSRDELLLESLLSESIVYYSPEVRDKLRYLSSKNVIAKDLVEVEGVDIEPDITFIDFGSEGYFTFIQMRQAIKMIDAVYPGAKDGALDKKFIPDSSDILYNNDRSGYKATGIYKNSRNQIKIGKVVNKLLGDKYNSSQIEEFVNILKTTQILPGDISIVSGDDIDKWYKSERYQSLNGSLGNSCMKDSNFLKLYVRNPESCQMVIMTVGDKLVSRALLWKLKSSNIEGNPEYFMDRVYSIRDKEFTYMREYADNQGWSYRSSSGYGRYDEVVYKGMIFFNVKMSIQVKPGDYKKYPYLDTFRRYVPKTGVLYNDEKFSKPGIIISRTDGDFLPTNYRGNLIQRLMGRFDTIPVIESKVDEGLFDLFKRKPKPKPHTIPDNSLFREIDGREWTDYMDTHRTEAWSKQEVDYLKSLSEYVQFRKKGVNDSAINHFYIQLVNKEIRITKYRDEWYDINYRTWKNKEWKDKHTFYLCDTWDGVLQCIDHILKDEWGKL